MVAGNRYSEFATTTSGSGSGHNQTQVRAEPGVGGAGQKAPGSLVSVLRLCSFPSRPSGPQSLACEGAVLAEPAAPVASAAFAHTDDLLSSLSALLPPALSPTQTMERRVSATIWYRTPEHPARVEGRTTSCCLSAPPGSGPRVGAAPSTPGPDRMKTRAQLGPFLSSVFATEQEAKVLRLCF